MTTTTTEKPETDKLAHAREQGRTQYEHIAELVAALQAAEHDTSDDDEARLAIDEHPLCIEVRSAWHAPGAEDANKPTEFNILLCTGGPAVRLIGELDQWCEPDNVRIEVQDWFTPWTEIHTTDEEDEILLAYCRCFWFGE